MSQGMIVPNFGLIAVLRDTESDFAINSAKAATKMFNLKFDYAADILVPEKLVVDSSAELGFRPYLEEGQERFRDALIMPDIDEHDAKGYLCLINGEEAAESEHDVKYITILQEMEMLEHQLYHHCVYVNYKADYFFRRVREICSNAMKERFKESLEDHTARIKEYAKIFFLT